MSKAQAGQKLPWGVTLLALLLLARLAPALLTPTRAFTYFFYDDSFYYFEIARNVAQGQGFSFDTLNATNGFQPLWQIVLVPFYWLVPNDLALAVRLIYAAQGVLAVLTCYHGYRLLRGFELAPQLCFVLLTLPYGLGTVVFSGMESALTLFFLILSLRALAALLRAEAPRRLDFLRAGLALALLFLARTDMGVLAVSAGLFWLIGGRGGWGARLRGLTWLALPLALTGGGFVALNLWQFGHPLPISNTLKSSFPKVGLYLPLARFGLLTWLGAGGVLLSLGSPRYLPLRPLLGMMALAGLIHYLYYFAFVKWGVLESHAVAYSVIFMLGLAGWASILPVRFPALKNILPRLALLLTLIWAGAGLWGQMRVMLTNRPDDVAVTYDVALWLRANTLSDAIIGMKDAGVVGYFSDRAVVNLDGLVNNFDYQTALVERGLNAYLCEQGVGYLVREEVPDALIAKPDYDALGYAYVSYLHDMAIGTLRLEQEDELYRQPYEVYTGRSIVVWRVDTCPRRDVFNTQAFDDYPRLLD